MLEPAGATSLSGQPQIASSEALECRRLSADWERGFIEFCAALERAGDTKFFHPHPFDEATLARICRYRGLDLYYVVVQGADVLAYGLLRGWDEGFEIPSLGIATHPAARSCGLGTTLMHLLHSAAARRGAKKVRLRVRADNHRAIALYERLDYSFTSADDEYRVGMRDLPLPSTQ